jgi:hypothetical protein
MLMAELNVIYLCTWVKWYCGGRQNIFIIIIYLQRTTKFPSIEQTGPAVTTAIRVTEWAWVPCSDLLILDLHINYQYVIDDISSLVRVLASHIRGVWVICRLSGNLTITLQLVKLHCLKGRIPGRLRMGYSEICLKKTPCLIQRLGYYSYKSTTHVHIYILI